MNTQFKKGIIDVCVLSLVSQDYTTVYQITKVLKGTLDVNENTIYPRLRRLIEQGYLVFDKKLGDAGAPKKIYQLTDSGISFLQEEKEEWHTFTAKVNEILGGHHE